jgi:hypothetical protein
MNVQLRNALRKIDRAQIEIEILKENREKAGLENIKLVTPSTSMASFKNNKKKLSPSNNSQHKLVKKYFNLEEILSDPVKTKLYIDKLNLQIIEKDAHIKDLTEKINNDNHKQTDSEESPSATSEL